METAKYISLIQEILTSGKSVGSSKIIGHQYVTWFNIW